ncbi:MAG: ABC transporter permease [Methanothrix sp.]|nr:ABC transporter permease [Methanothrix sp.]
MNQILSQLASQSKLGAEGAYAILWSDMVALRRNLRNYLIATVVSPLLYMAAFGFGLGANIKMDGMSYLEFVVPGIIAMTAMNSSFNGSGTRLVVDQIHWRSFDESLMAPIGHPSLLLGKALIGALRGSVSSIAFLIMAFLIRPQLHISLLFLFSLALTCLIFSFLGVLSALLARSYDDMIMFTSIIITPMAFLGGTFFSLNYVPEALKYALYLLPLTHASICLRASILGQNVPYNSLSAMLGFLAIFAGASLLVLRKKDV